MILNPLSQTTQPVTNSAAFLYADWRSQMGASCVYSTVAFLLVLSISLPISQGFQRLSTCARFLQRLKLDCKSTNIEAIKKELNELEGMYQYYYYVIQRNDAQKESFVSEEAQWEFMDPYDQDVIINHRNVLQRIEELQNKLTECGGKIMDQMNIEVED